MTTIYDELESAVICVLGIVSVEKGLQWMERPECIRGVIGLLAFVVGILLIWKAGLNILL